MGIDNFKIIFFPKWNNPNTKIQNDLKNTARLGNTGWFNENFNQLTNNFNIDSVAYFDTSGNPVDAVDYFASTKVVIIASGVNNVNTNTKCGFGFMWVPRLEEDYKNKHTPFYQNAFIQTGAINSAYNVETFYPAINTGAGINSASMDYCRGQGWR